MLAVALLGAGCGRELPGQANDSTPPATTYDLTVTTINDVDVTLAWTVPGDDDYRGAAAAYEIRRGDGSFSWRTATVVGQDLNPGVPGSRDSLVVGGLRPNTRYYFAARAHDANGNLSGVSNVVECRTTTSLAVKSPADGDAFCLGDSIVVQWPVLSWMGRHVEIVLSNYYGYSTVLADSTENDGHFVFHDIADRNHAGGYVIGLMDLDSGLRATSNGHFSISSDVQLAAAGYASSRSVCRDATIPVTWTTNACTRSPVRIELLAERVVVAVLAEAAPNTGTFSWAVGDFPDIGAAYQLRITAVEIPGLVTETRELSISSPAVPPVSVPATGDTLNVGDEQFVAWSGAPACDQQYLVQVMQDGVACAELAAGIWGTEILWVVEGCGDMARPYVIRVTGSASGAISESGPFHISDACRMRVTNLSVAGTAIPGQQVTVAWTSANACGNRVDIDLLDGEGSAIPMARDVATPNSYTLTMPELQPGFNPCRIRVRATVSGVYADSPEFGLVCSPVLVSPDGSGDFFRLSDAIAVSGNGFVIELADGTHAGPGSCDIALDGKNLAIRSRSGDPERCIVDCAGANGFLTATNCADGVVISGLTIRELAANSTTSVSAVKAVNSRVEVSNCRFRTLRFTSPSGYAAGAAILAFASEATIRDCLFHDVVSEGTISSAGGAIAAREHSDVSIVGCTFVGIRAANGSVVDVQTGSLSLERCIIFGNATRAVGPAATTLGVACCDIYANANGDWTGPLASLLGEAGNIAVNPEFCDFNAADFRLQEGSPCRAAASGCAGDMGALGVGCAGR